MKPNEAAFEEYVATWLVEDGGYDHLKGPGQARPPSFDPVTGIDTEDLFEFIGATEVELPDDFAVRFSFMSELDDSHRTRKEPGLG